MITAFVAAAACWWIYFDHGERIGSDVIEASESPGRLARTAYTWVHLAVVGGIVMLGVGDKEVLGHPHEQSFPAVVTVLGGPLLFLVGTLLFRRVLERRWAVAQLGGLLALAVVAAFTPLHRPADDRRARCGGAGGDGGGRDRRASASRSAEGWMTVDPRFHSHRSWSII